MLDSVESREDDFLETDERSKASSVFTAVGGGSGASWHALVADTDAADADAADVDAAPRVRDPRLQKRHLG